MKYKLKEYPELKVKVETMAVEDMLRTIICPFIWPDYPTPTKTGAVFLHPRTVPEANAMTEEINGGRENPALIVSDMECGPGNAIVGAVKFPSMRAVGEAGSVEDAYEMGVIAAKQAREAGYHWTLGPCVDIAFNHNSPIVSIRSAGTDADTIIKYSGAYIDGLQDNGLIATIKHFPGDGLPLDDQHLTVSTNPLSKEEWDKTYGKVYKTLIDKGVKAVMPGHIALPSYDDPDENGIYPPGSLSKKLLVDLLRGELGFEGIIVSDAVNMTGFSGYMNLYKACCRFLELGGDCLLFMCDTDEYIEEMKKCIEEGYLSLETLKLRAYRMLCFAKEYFENAPQNEELNIDVEAAEAAAKRVAVNATKIIRDRQNILPLKLRKDGKILHVILYNDWEVNNDCAEEVNAKLEQFTTVEVLKNPHDFALMEKAKSGEYDYIVCSVIERGSYAIQTARLCGLAGRSMMSGWMKFKTPVVFIDYFNCNFSYTFNAVADTMINTYGFTKYTADAIIDRLTK